MEALSRLKATPVWGLFWTFSSTEHENIGSRLVKGCHAEAALPRESYRATRWMYALTWATLLDKSNIGLRNMHARLRSTSMNQPPLTDAGNPVLIGRKQVFFWKWRWLARTEAYGQGYVDNVTPFTGFSTSSKLTLLILSEHSKLQPAWCALPLLHYSTQQLRAFPFLMRTSSWMARLDCATRSCQPTSSCSCGRSLEAQWQHGRSGCPESRLVETEWGQSATLGRCTEDGSSRPAFFCGCCASFLLTLSRLFRSAAGCIQDYVETSVLLHYNHRRLWDNNVDVFELTP